MTVEEVKVDGFTLLFCILLEVGTGACYKCFWENSRRESDYQR